MKIYEDYFSTYRHIESNNPEPCTWTHIDSTGLAEVIDLAQQNGYGFKFNFYDEDFTFKGESFPRHRRTLILFKEKDFDKQTVIDAIRNKLQFFRDDMTCKTAAEIRNQIEEIINSIELVALSHVAGQSIMWRSLNPQVGSRDTSITMVANLFMRSMMMNGVTIENLYDDFTVPRTEAREWGKNYELYAKLAETKIIPRKIAEEAMEQCDFYLEHFKDQDNERAVGATFVATQIKNLLEELLRQFEEGAEDNE